MSYQCPYSGYLYLYIVDNFQIRTFLIAVEQNTLSMDDNFQIRTFFIHSSRISMDDNFQIRTFLIEYQWTTTSK